MQQDFEECTRRVLLSEGGYSNDSRDPGGPTNRGITLETARLYWKPDATVEDIRDMSLATAVQIYKREYWDKLSGDALPSGVDYACFDYGVNSGPVRAGRVLRATLGLSQSDWRVTDEVLNALSRVAPVRVVDTICAERLTFLQELPTFSVYGSGWTRRVAGVKAYADHLASEAEGDGPQHPENLAAAKAYASDAGPILGVPPVLPTLDTTQNATVEPVGSPLVSYSVPPATQVAPQAPPQGTPPSMFRSKTGWIAWALGGSGGITLLDKLNDYGAELSSAQFNLMSFSGVFAWIYHHPWALAPVAVIAMAAYVWQDHRKYKRLLWEAQRNSLKCSPSYQPCLTLSGA